MTRGNRKVPLFRRRGYLSPDFMRGFEMSRGLRNDRFVSFECHTVQYYCTASVSLRPSSIGHHHSITANPSHNSCSNPTKFLILCFVLVRWVTWVAKEKVQMRTLAGRCHVGVFIFGKNRKPLTGSLTHGPWAQTARSGFSQP
jgi:hypothetical protein